MKKTTPITNQPAFLLGLTGLLVLGVGIIASIILNSRSQDLREQAQVVESGTCSLDITIGTPPDVNCVKKTYQDEFDNVPGTYYLRRVLQTAKAGDTIVWAIDVTNTGSTPVTISLTDVLSPNNLNYVTFVDSNCGPNAYNTSNRTLTCALSDLVASSGQARVVFRVRIADNTPVGTVITNSASIAGGDVSNSCSVDLTIDEESGQKICNEACESDKECDDAQNQRCVDTGAGFFCRNVSCSSEADCICTASTPTPNPTSTPSNSPTPTPVPTNTPTPTPGTGGNTPTPIPTSTPSPIPTSTPISTATPTPVSTPTPGATPTNSPTPTPGTGGNTPTPTPTSSPTPRADLELQKTVSTTTPTVGQNITFTIQVTNKGPNTTENVTVKDVLPSSLTFVSANATKGSYNSSNGIWTIGTLSLNETVYLYITARVDSAASITNIAEVVTSTLPDPDSTPGNNVTGEDDQDDVTLNSTKVLAQCEQTCTYNSDCADSNHICFNTGSKTVCRLASNPTSSTCVGATSTPAPTNQPQLPAAGGTGSTFVIVATAITILVLAALGLLLLL